MNAPSDKSRLDQVLVERGLATTRAQARDLILRGAVKVDGSLAKKPGQTVQVEAELQVAEGEGRFVSRGALKLQAGLDHFGFDPQGRNVLDIGASTGGFTQLLLERGASRITAVDVGRDQLHASLRSDVRVDLLEGTDARALTRADVPEPINAIVADVSFISLTKVLEVPLSFAQPGSWLVTLIKPQFEVGRDRVGKGGIVRDESARKSAVDDVSDWLARHQGWQVLGILESPITGGGGNQEYLIGATFRGADQLESSVST